MNKSTEEDRYEAWFRKQVQIVINQANAGKTIPAEEVEAYFAEKRAASRKRAKLP